MKSIKTLASKIHKSLSLIFFYELIYCTVLVLVLQGLDVLSDVIYHLETFDVTTIRASTPMFLLARRIKVG